MCTFPQCLLQHLTRIKSDHWPLLLSTRQDLRTPKGRPFRLIVGWTQHNTFPTFTNEQWNYAGCMVDSLSNFTSDVKFWNRNVYGFLGTRKHHLMRSLGNIQQATDHFPSKTKGSLYWLQLRDRNTKCYHSRTIKRRNFNRITAFRIDNRDWCTDQDILCNKVVEFFKRLYGEVLPNIGTNPYFSFLRLTSSEISILEADITNEEIKKVLFNMAPLKVPGTDGFHAHFFKFSGISLEVMRANELKVSFREGLLSRN
ncbi:hypothetical protein J1N35_018148 [Gossypium stocksii]|uniref:Uncharacterized protein n=1 Tax=Gossypium stocksii TaxID=47602 RepID=A0A9D3VNF6_9ROSI|nr:hypothetical protein J1N35_018148 [Gossypium stocksii]